MSRFPRTTGVRRTRLYAAAYALGFAAFVFSGAVGLTLVFDGVPSARGWFGGAGVALACGAVAATLHVLAARSRRLTRTGAGPSFSDASEVIRYVVGLAGGYLAMHVLRAGRLGPRDVGAALARPAAMFVVLLLGVAVLAACGGLLELWERRRRLGRR